MLAILMLAALFTIPRLNDDAFSNDELRSVIVAGGGHHGPLTFPTGVWTRVAEQSPDQALGFPLLIWWWGNFVGWSELATRVLPALAGFLTIALTYRLGHDLFNRFVGNSAATILASSLYFTTFMHKFRVFTLASALLGTAIYCYWRIVYKPHPAWLPAIGLLLSGIGLVYAHYFVTPIIAAIGLYHLFIAPKSRRWWLPVLLFIPVALSFIPEYTVLQMGFSMNQTRTDLRAEALSPLGMAQLIAHFFGNGYALMTWIALGLALYVLTRTGMMHHAPTYQRNFVMLWFISVALFALMAGVNALSGVFVARRVRYMMGMWVPLALLVSVGFWQLRQWGRYLPVIALALWAAIGIGVSWQNTLLTFNEGDQVAVLPWRDYTATILSHWEPGDAEIFSGDDVPAHGHYTHAIPRRTVVPPYWGGDIMRAGFDGALRVWWGINTREDQAENVALLESLLNEQHYIPCDTYLTHELVTLTLYVASPAFCPNPDSDVIFQFGNDLTLRQVEQIQQENRLTLNTGWDIAPDIPINTYSVGFHITEPNDINPIQQVDIGLNAADGPYMPLHAELDLSNLPAGRYDVRVLVYAWETGVRLPIKNTESIADSALLTTIVIE